MALCRRRPARRPGRGPPRARGEPVDARSRVTDPLDRLLEVQDHDTAVDQLRHRRATLPARTELARLETRRRALAARRAHRRCRARRARGAPGRPRGADRAAGRARRAEIEKRMFGGQVRPRRDLQAMDEEVKHLARHVDRARGPRARGHGGARAARRGAGRGWRGARAEIEGRPCGPAARAWQTQEAAIDQEIAAPGGGRGSRRPPASPPSCSPRYEKLRAKLGGTGAAPSGGRVVQRVPPGPPVHGGRPHPQGAARRAHHLRAVRPDPGPLRARVPGAPARAPRRDRRPMRPACSSAGSESPADRDRAGPGRRAGREVCAERPVARVVTSPLAPGTARRRGAARSRRRRRGRRALGRGRLRRVRGASARRRARRGVAAVARRPDVPARGRRVAGRGGRTCP